MTVLTSEGFAQICYALWGEDWKAKASVRLERSRRQLRNIENGSNVTSALRRELLVVVDEQIAVLQSFQREFSQ